MIRTIALWGAVVLVLVILGVTLQPPADPRVREAPQLPYSELLRRAEAGDVAGVETRGTLVIVTPRDGRTYVAYVPEGSMSETVRRLYEAGVEIRARPRPSGPTIGDVILGILPMLLLIGAWYFFMRQMQRKGQESGN